MFLQVIYGEEYENYFEVTDEPLLKKLWHQKIPIEFDPNGYDYVSYVIC